MIIRRLFLQYPDSVRPLIDVQGEYALEPGLWALSGHSGIGKTSLLRLLCGWFAIDEERPIYWTANVDWDPVADADLVGNDAGLLPWKTVLANLELRCPTSGIHQVHAFIEATGLGLDVLNAWPYELSLGMYKRVEFVAALLRDRRLLLLDEFFGSLDHESRRRCFELVCERRKDKVTIVSTHSPETLSEASTRHIVLRRDSGQPTIVGLQFDEER